MNVTADIEFVITLIRDTGMGVMALIIVWQIAVKGLAYLEQREENQQAQNEARDELVKKLVDAQSKTADVLDRLDQRQQDNAAASASASATTLAEVKGARADVHQLDIDMDSSMTALRAGLEGKIDGVPGAVKTELQPALTAIGEGVETVKEQIDRFEVHIKENAKKSIERHTELLGELSHLKLAVDKLVKPLEKVGTGELKAKGDAA